VSTRILAGLLAVALVAMAWWTIEQRQDMNEKIAVLESELAGYVKYTAELEATADSVKAHTDSVLKAAADSIRHAEDATREATAEAVEARVRLRELVPTLDLTEQQRTVLERRLTELESAYELAIMERDKQIRFLHVQVNALTERLDAELALRDGLRQQLAVANDLIAEQRAALNPPFHVKLGRDLPQKLVLVGAGIIGGVAISR